MTNTDADYQEEEDPADADAETSRPLLHIQM